MSDYETILYATDGPVATVTLNRPDRLNTIVPPMPDELEAAIERATLDRTVKVIVLRGAGRSFCAGFDFGGGFHHWDEHMTTDGRWDPGKDFVLMSQSATGPVPKFMSIWRTLKPVIAQVHGWCVGGGSDMALCADLVIVSDDAVIGTPYARMWGCYLSGMWLYRLGLTRAKELALTGRPLVGPEAVEWGLVNRSVPFAELEETVRAQALELASLPASQLAAMKLIVNHAYEQQGINAVQTLGPILDGLMRNTPDADAWIQTAQNEGVAAALERRDGPFGDYSHGPPDRRPDPRNVIEP